MLFKESLKGRGKHGISGDSIRSVGKERKKLCLCRSIFRGKGCKAILLPFTYDIAILPVKRKPYQKRVGDIQKLSCLLQYRVTDIYEVALFLEHLEDIGHHLIALQKFFEPSTCL